MNSENIRITKASGEKTFFSADKLRYSLARSGADSDTVDSIISKVQFRLYQGISTEEIYRMAFDLLKKHSRTSAGKYHMKRAIMELGPSGFPFEKYVAKILTFKKFKITLNQIVSGRCVNHEVDIIAEKGTERFMIECKFHNAPGITCNVKTPLYIQARFKDIETISSYVDSEIRFHKAWLVTNTKFTADSIQYGNCAGLYLLGWNYPPKESLKELIDESGLYPVTCLTTLSAKEKKYILGKGIVLCSELIDEKNVWTGSNISETRIKNIQEECKKLTHSTWSIL
jgi:hypothetical protein